MRDHDRHAGHAAEDRPPQVGTEHVRMNDVDGLVAKEGHKSPKRHHVEAAGPVECEVRDALREDCVQKRAAGMPRRRHCDLEAIAR